MYWSIRGRGLLDFVGRRGAAVPCPVARWVAYRPPGGGAQRPRLADDLRDVTVVETGLPLLQVEEHVDEVIAKLDLPADVDRYREGSLETLHVAHGGRVAPFSAVARPLGPTRSAMHAEHGLLLLAGPGIRTGEELPPSDLVDLAPTLLRTGGMRIPDGLDGKPLDVFA